MSERRLVSAKIVAKHSDLETYFDPLQGCQLITLFGEYQYPWVTVEDDDGELFQEYTGNKLLMSDCRSFLILSLPGISLTGELVWKKPIDSPFPLAVGVRTRWHFGLGIPRP